MKIRILLIANQFYPDIGGIQTFATELASFLANDLKFDLHICTLRTQYKPDGEIGYKIYNLLYPRSALHLGWGQYFITNSLIVLRLLFQLRPQIVISTNYFPVSFLTSLPTKIFGFKHIVYVHGSEVLYSKSSRFLKWVSYITDRGIDFLIFNSSFTKSIIRERKIFSNIKNISVIPPVFPTNYFKRILSFKKCPPQKNGKLRLLSICRLHKRKAIHNVLKAISRLDSLREQIDYWVVGDGEREYIEYLKSIIRRYNLGDCVHFLGNKPPQSDELLNLLRNADAFIMTPIFLNNNFESFGIVYFEALCAGLPVVGSYQSGAPDLKKFFHDQVTLVNPLAEGEIANAIINIINNRSRHQNIKSKVDSYFAQAVVNKWKRLLDSDLKMTKATVV